MSDNNLCAVCIARFTTGDEQTALSDAVADWLLTYRRKEHIRRNLITDLRTSKSDAIELLTLIAETARANKPESTF